VFVFSDTTAEFQLWRLVRADGPKAVDFGAVLELASG